MRSMKTTGGLTRGRGMTETQRNVWLLSMPACAEVNSAMQELTGISYETSEQHKETLKARVKRDSADTREILGVLAMRNPFGPDKSLRNIMNGVTADSKVNAYRAKEIGAEIVQSMLGSCVDTFSFTKKMQIVPMSSRTTADIGGETIQIDSELLFQRLIATNPSPDELPALFQYELCSYPPSLFDNNALPRPATKSVLSNELWKLVENVNTTKPLDSSSYVLDGGALLHRVPWTKGKTYGEICQVYVKHLETRYGKKVTVVFDGYETPSIKDVAHMRRSKVPGPTVKLECNMVCKLSREEFLSNTSNKETFIKLLGLTLEMDGHTVHYSTGDADCLIVKVALESAQTTNTVVIGDDADLLVNLLHHADPNGPDLYFKPEAKSKKGPKSWNIRKSKQTLDMKNPVCDNLLFMHAILGCDSTSSVHGIGKGSILKKVQNQSFCDAAATFLRHDSSKESVIQAGEKAMIIIYGDNKETSLDELRYKKFCNKTATGMAAVQLKTLPPTSAAMAFHSQRVYYQVQEWKGKTLDPFRLPYLCAVE